MKEPANAWAMLALVLALPGACADVTEAVSGSATNDGAASSSGAATGPDDGPSTADGVDTTDGSAGGSEAVTEATVASETSGPGTGSSDGTSGAATSTSDGSSDDGATTMAGVDPCDPDVADSACDTCVKMACCPQIQTCFQDVGCACVMPCLGDGYGPLECFGACGLVDAPPGANELGTCAGNSCGAACGA